MDPASYFLVQYVSDLFRQEPRNVGVIVRKGDEVAARFAAEDAEGQIDGRRLKQFAHPDVYRQWVSYWRRAVSRGSSAWADLSTNSGQHYQLKAGGAVTDTGGDTAQQITDYLFNVLVSDGGLLGAMTEPDNENRIASAISVPRLNLDVEAELRRVAILAPEQTSLIQVRHPVLAGSRVVGASHVSHRPDFVQQNGRLSVMATVDLTLADKARAKDHAGLVAYMFDDIRDAQSDAETISIVRICEEDTNQEDVAFATAILNAESRIVNWCDAASRAEFIEDRVRIAQG